MKYMIFCLGVFLLPISNLAAADKEKESSTAYKDINAMFVFIKNNTSSPYISIQQQAIINDENIKFDDISMWLTNNAEHLGNISIDTEGVIILPVLDPSIAETALLHINQGKGAVAISLGASVLVPEQTEVSYKDLFILLEDTNNFMSEMAGVASWFMSDMDALEFYFDAPAIISINSKKKTYTYETDDEFNIEIDISRRLMKENPRVIFSILPIGMTPKD